MKKIIRYLLAVLMTAWTGALTIAVCVYMMYWLSAVLSAAGESRVFTGAASIAALVIATAAASALVKERIREWDKDKK